MYIRQGKVGSMTLNQNISLVNGIETENTSSYKAWLQYAKLEDQEYKKNTGNLLKNIVVPENSLIINSATEELSHGITSMYGVQPKVDSNSNEESNIYLLTETTKNDFPSSIDISGLNEEGYIIKTEQSGSNKNIYIVGKTDRGVLYGSFHFLRLIQMNESLIDLAIKKSPVNQLRMINQWDNMDGSIERGYSGRSIFYENYSFSANLTRIKDYARLLSSVGINGISINNVNVHKIESQLVTTKFLPDVKKVAAIFRAYGIKTFLSVNYASPIELGKLDTADPLDTDVKQWWKDTATTIYNYIPDFGGFVVKADSENRPGPFTYDRDHSDGANMLADALEAHGGLVIWRCFVYNCHQDWRDRETDRARAAYDHFTPLDGKFKDNVILQIKNGPMDFQVREPVSPLIGSLKKTNHLMEFQVAQEYTGQQKHVCYLVPQWKEILEFDTHANGEGTKVKSVVDGSQFQNKYAGIAAVSNIGNDYNWTGHTLAQANLYGYGRLIWNPDHSSDELLNEWVRLTFGNQPDVVETVTKMLENSWEIYENYTAPLGVGWMVNPGHHYGPNVDGYEYSAWGTYHFADRDGIGVDRTVKSGTGYTNQYHAPNAEIYENLETCPDDLILFFHHVPYDHQLKSGKTIIQHIYDTHFEGVEEAKWLLDKWRNLEGQVDSVRFSDVRERLEDQWNHSKQWRDQINTYFYRKSGISDEKERTIY